MEVDARGSGGGSVTDRPDEDSRRRTRLNITLYALALVCVAAVGLVGAQMWSSAYGADGAEGWWDRAVAVASDDPDDVGSRAGERIGDARVAALPEASAAEQERTAAIIDAATKMSNAFLNLSHDDVEASTEAVRALATGAFLKQYDKSTESLAKVARRAKSTQTGEVLWAGVVASDEDSATVIVASSGTVANKLTEFEPTPRNYRLQLELVLKDDRWLTRDLQFVP